MPSATQKQDGAIKKTADGFTFLDPKDFYDETSPPICRAQAEFKSRSQIPTTAKVFTAPIPTATG